MKQTIAMTQEELDRKTIIEQAIDVTVPRLEHVGTAGAPSSSNKVRSILFLWGKSNLYLLNFSPITGFKQKNITNKRRYLKLLIKLIV